MKTWELLRNNPSLFDRYFVKEYLIKASRNFFEKRGYHELESPILASALPQERYLDVLATNLTFTDGRQKKAYLIPSTETYNKKILAAGIGNHFVISKVFRGLEDIGPNHSPEFTMMEWYDLNSTYLNLMNDCEKLVNEMHDYLCLKQNTHKTESITYNGKNIDLTPSWYRITVSEVLKKYANIELKDIQTLDKIEKVATQKGYQIEKNDDWETIFELIFLNEVEPNLPQEKPLFLYDYPKILCPLTKTSQSNPLVCEKVELYIAGREIANGYTELRDWKEQERRFKEEQNARKTLNKDEIRFDNDLINALKAGIPPVAGMGLGIDRLAMIFADAKNISDINYFPATELFE